MSVDSKRLFLFCVVSLVASALAYDICVADVNEPRNIYPWFPCKAKDSVTSSDFKLAKLRERGNTSNAFNATATLALVADWPGLNTLGLSIARLDLAPGGVIPPHTHPAASELLFVLEGIIHTGFVTPDNKLYEQTVEKGEAFVLPKGMLHFQHNNGTDHASAVSVMNGEDPSIQLMPLAFFGSGISPEIIAKSAFISEREAVLEADIIRSKYSSLFVHKA